MTISVFDLFRVGIGPSSSHTVGPMRAARRFAEELADSGLAPRTATLRAELFGSLGLTGKGHGSDKAVVLGLSGERPESVDPDGIPALMERVASEGRVRLPGGVVAPFRPAADLVFHRRKNLPLHPNGMRFSALDAEGAELCVRIFYSIGGGFVVDEEGHWKGGEDPPGAPTLPHPFTSGRELLETCTNHGMSIADVMLMNECAWRTEADVRAQLLAIWAAMRACVERGCRSEGVLPGGLQVRRRAPALHRELRRLPLPGDPDHLHVMDWVNLWALAVNEENADGGRVVTAPTNGAAGVVPAVLHYYTHYRPGADDDGVVRFLLTAGAVGILFKRNASISGAEVGCQGEVGVACAMAAAGLTEALRGTPAQVENAAEIGMEHNLGLTCDPVGGLVQIPCIERNAMGAVKAINASRLALRGDGSHHISLDRVIRTMRQTGKDMMAKYKETSRGGLAVNVIEC